MSEPATKHHLRHQDPAEAATAAMNIADLMEHPGWSALISSIDRLLRHEQTLMMTTGPEDELKTQRKIGRWAGLRELEAIARGIAQRGEEAERELRRPDNQ